MKRSILTTTSILALATSSQAASTYVQSYDLSQVFYSGAVVSNAYYTLPPIEKTFQPFDSSLGTLDYADITWNITMGGEGTTGTTSGSFSYSFGSSVYVNDIFYDGFGGGGGTGGPADTFVSYSSNGGQASEFRATDTASDNQQIWAVVTGSSEFTIQGTTPDEDFGDYQFFGTFSDITIELVDSDLSLTYHYTPTAVPEPTSTSLLGLSSLFFILRRRRS